MKHDRLINVLQRPRWTDGEPVIDRGAFGAHWTSSWGDRRIGLGTSAGVVKPAPTYEELVARSRPVDKEGKPRPHWSDKAEHRFDLEQDERRRRYALQLAAAGKSYNDGLRAHLKAACGPDFKQYTPRTHEGLYWHLTDKWESQPRHSALLLALILPYRQAWFIVAVFALFRRESKLPPRWYSCFVTLHDEITGVPKGNREIVEHEVISDDRITGCRERSKKDRHRRRGRQPTLPDWPEELALINRAQARDEGARNRLLLNYQRKAAKIAKPLGTRLIPVRELVVVALIGCEDDSGKVTNGLLYALQKFDPENGGRFSSFATAAMEWAIYQYLGRNPRQLSLNSNVAPDEDEDTWLDRVPDETEDVEESEAETERRIVALGCLTERERLMLQAYHVERKTLSEIGEQWSISGTRVWQIIQAAAEKARMKISAQNNLAERP